MDSILRYYDEHVRLVNNATKVFENENASNSQLQHSLYTLVHSISNKKGASNIFFRKYCQDLVDGYDDNEEEYREGFEDYQHEITKHIDQNQLYITFDPDDKIKHININLFDHLDLKKHHFSIRKINNLNNKELVSKIQEYIAISRHYFQFFFFGLDITIEYIKDSFTEHFEKSSDKSNSKKGIKSRKKTSTGKISAKTISEKIELLKLKTNKTKTEEISLEYLQYLLDNPQKPLSKKAKLENDRKLSEEFKKLENNSDEIEILEIKPLEIDRTYDFQKRLQQIGFPIKGSVKRDVKVISDSSFGFNHSYIEHKQKLIDFIEHSCFVHDLLKDLEQKKELTKHLFSKNLVHLGDVTIDFNKKTNILSTFLDFIRQYFESGLNEKIERRKLFRSETGTIIKANNLNNAIQKVEFLETLTEEYKRFNQKP